MSNSPKYEVIYNEYKNKIISGEILKGVKLPTEMEIASQFKVSRITVTRALKELETRNFIHRIKGSGSYVNDKSSWNSRSKGAEKDQQLSIISLILPFEGKFSYDIFRGIEDVAKENNYLVTFHNSSDLPATEGELISELKSKGSHGMIIYPATGAENMDVFSRLIIEKFPFVLIDRKVYGIESSLVWTDNQKGFYDITNHLLDLGHKRIVFAGNSVYQTSSELNRYNGFCQAHIEKGIPLMHKNLFSAEELKNIPDDYMSDESAEERICHHILDQFESMPPQERPTAIAAVNDQTAAVIIKTAMKRGIRIPEDYSVIGFDNEPYASHLPVPLSTVEQPVYEIGRKAAEELFKRIKNPEKKVTSQTVAPKILIRKSTSQPSL